MPCYFFNLYDDLDTLDEEGTELPDLHAAEVQGLMNVRAVAADQVRHGKLDLWHRLEITDARGDVLKVIRFADAVEVFS